MQERTTLPLSLSLHVCGYVLILSVRMSLYIYVCISVVVCLRAYASVCSSMRARLSSVYTVCDNNIGVCRQVEDKKDRCIEREEEMARRRVRRSDERKNTAER